jgi:capsular exopolysaccharide synthesis family protein
MSKIMNKLGEAAGTAEDVQAQPTVDPNAQAFDTGTEASGTETNETRFEPMPQKAPLADETAPWDAQHVDPAVIAFHNRYAPVCEQYRSVRARLQSMNPKHERRVIAVTSSVPEEGKSVTTANLGIVMAEGGEQRVLLADTDFRRSSLAKMLGLRPSPGLAEVFLGRAKLSDVICPTPYTNLRLIPAGNCGDVNYGDLLASPGVGAALEELRNTFDICLLDTPPVTTVSDVSLLAPLCDAALMVIEMGRTPEPTVQLAVRTLQTNNVNVCGCLLSRYRDRRSHYYDRYHYYYHRA